MSKLSELREQEKALLIDLNYDDAELIRRLKMLEPLKERIATRRAELRKLQIEITAQVRQEVSR